MLFVSVELEQAMRVTVKPC